MPAAEIRAREKLSARQATVSLPELARGGIALAFATVTPGFLAADVGEDFEPRSALYHTQEEAEAQALAQIDLYEQWQRQGRVRLVKSVLDLEDHLSLWQQDRVPGLVLLMESADPIASPADLPRWWQRGLRMVGLTFGDTRYGAGTASGSPTFKTGGLTPAGQELIDGMAGLGFIWDISHLAEEGVWQGFERGFPRVCASHATARALIRSDRHLSDAVLRALARRGGIIGLPLYNGFLDPPWRHDHELEVSLVYHFRRHAAYLASLIGWEHVGIGSDLDGGFGLEESPCEIDTVADLNKIGLVLPADVKDAVLGDNWLRFLRASLPKTSLPL